MSIGRTGILTIVATLGLIALAGGVETSPGEEPDPFATTITMNGHAVPQPLSPFPTQLILMLRTHDLTTEVFTCPSGGDGKDLLIDANGNRL